MNKFPHTAQRLSLALLAALTTLPVATLAQPSGWYAGAAVGRSAATIDDARIASGLQAQGLATSSITNRDRDTGYKLFGGYQLTPNLAVEAGLFHLGSFGYTATTVPAGTLGG